jgi:hypothetical protein
MITNNGKDIMTKYLIGQAPSYASHIAIGCGPKPLVDAPTTEQKAEYVQKDTLDFEMFRVPVTSRGYVDDGGVSKVVLTAELPTQDRYAITEVGLFSQGSNPSAGAYDSKLLYSFNDDENWEYHSGETAMQLPSYIASLGDDATPYNIVKTDEAFFTIADNRSFTNLDRIERHETPRFLNSVILMDGASSDLQWDGSQLEPATGSSHIHITGINTNLNKNSPQDELRMAFSVVNRVATSNNLAQPDSARILIEFASSDVLDGEWARMEIVVNEITGVDQTGDLHDLINNRYVVVTKQLQDLHKSSGFTWSAVDVIKVYSSVYYDGAPSSEFFIALDALRLENVKTINPLYGLTGYSAVQTTDGLPIIKYSNTSNLVEFRFAIGVQ